MNGPERSPCAVRPSASSRVRHASRLFGLLAAMVALAGHANGDQATPDLEYLLVRPTELPGLNLGWEFPGASGRVETADDPQRGPCHRVHYDLSKGGRYVRMEAACPPADVWAIRFALRRPTDAGQMFFAIRDATDQYFRGAIEVKGPDWQEMEIPLTEERFSAHHGGANDGRIHRPVRVVCIEMEAPEKVGEFVVDELRAVLDDPAKPPVPRVFIQPDPPGGVAFLNEKAVYKLVLDNRLSVARNLAFLVTADDQDGKRLYAKRHTLEAEAFGIAERSFDLETKSLGYQLIAAIAEGKDSAEGGGATLEIQSGLAVVVEPQRYHQADPESFFAVHQDKGLLETACRLGAKAVMWSSNWLWTEPVPGRYVWADEYLEQCEKLGLGMVIKFNHFTPSWAIWHDAPRPELQPFIAPEHLASFGKWVGETVKRYKGRLQAVEFINEPDLGYWQGANLDLETAVDMYVKTLEAGYAAVKAVDPNLCVWGVGVSSYDQGTGFRFTEAVLDKAAGAFDHVGSHPYPWSHYIGNGRMAQDAEEGEMAGKCRTTLDLLEKYGKPRTMSIGELGWALHLSEPPLGPDSIAFAEMMSQAHIIARSVEELRQVYWFTMDAHDEGGYWYGLLRGWPDPLYPLPAACAYATCAAMIDHTRPAGPLAMNPTIRAWRFDRTDADLSVFALWATDEEMEILAKLPESAKVIDSYGRSLDVANGKGFALSGLPVYIATPQADADRTVAALEGAQTKASRDLRISRPRLVSDRLIEATVTNYTNKPIKAKVSFSQAAKEYLVNPGQEALRLAVTPLPDDPAAKPVPLVLEWEGGRDQADVRVDLAPIVDLRSDGSYEEKIARLRATPPLTRTERTAVLPSDPTIPWSGPADLGLKTWFGGDDQALYIAVEITDDLHCVPFTDEGYWQSDSLQLGIDPHNDSTANYDENDTELGFAGATDGEPAARISAPVPGPLACKHLKIERDETAKTTRYQAVIGWDIVLGKNAGDPRGTVMAINLIANDNDGQGRACWIGLTPGIGEEKRPAQYLRFVVR
ncbi:MAG: hypothetical protein GXY33_07420 [Phycisphaerae bacterium]|nr:hypothetical protein [Phycisphaerae bacterium]